MSDRLVARAEIAKQLRVTERTITAWVKSARLDDGAEFPSRVEGRERKFPEDRCFEWFIRYKQEDAVRMAAGPAKRSHGEEREDREAEIKLGMQEIQFARLRGEVVEIDQYRKELRRILGRVAAKVRTITGEFAPRILEPLDMPRAVKLLREMQNRLLGELATSDASSEEPEPKAEVA